MNDTNNLNTSDVSSVLPNTEANEPQAMVLNYDGLWKQNPAIVQLLGLCPVLAVSNNLANAFSLGIATLLVLMLTSGLVASLRHRIPPAIRNPVFILIIASVVTCVDLAINAFFHELYLILGIFIPLITTNCIVLARAEAFASKQNTLSSLFDGMMMGLGLLAVLCALGFVRELLGQGTVFAHFDLLFGDTAKAWAFGIPIDGYQFLLMLLPAGAFLTLAFFAAYFQLMNQK
jgi:electron transport complex protein RnfE